ncbi:hypothetical protein WJ30_12215 [Burkholderia diffusa]|nr:hypothetical protein WJ30_12215 [Burkholderia diffusa]
MFYRQIVNNDIDSRLFFKKIVNRNLDALLCSVCGVCMVFFVVVHILSVQDRPLLTPWATSGQLLAIADDGATGQLSHYAVFERRTYPQLSGCQCGS